MIVLENSNTFREVILIKVILKNMREKRGWNQAELSRRSGVPQPMISEIETGQVAFPRIDTLYKLARALRCAVEDLIVEDEKVG